MEYFIDFFNGSSSINMVEVIFNVILASIMSQLVYLVFVRFGNTFSNRKHFGKIFFLLTVSTTIIISIIQASLALSLGLVGALSIVRFRTAIKEPEELTYAFFSITIGLGCGANARGLTIVCGLFVLGIIVLKGLLSNDGNECDIYNFNVVSKNMSLSILTDIIEKNTVSSSLRRADTSKSLINAQYIVEFDNIEQLEQLNAQFIANDPDVSTSFVSNSTFI